MAGIGFRLQKLLKKESLLSVLKAYGYSAVIGSGSWIIAVGGLIFTASIVKDFLIDKHYVLQFLTTTTYLFALSLIYTGFFQLYFSRYISDRIFEKKLDKILPNIIGMIVFTLFFGFFLVLPSAFILVDTSIKYRLLFIFSFLVLSGIWILNVILSALKTYRYIFYSFAVSYFLIFILAIIFTFFNFGLEGLLASFLIGHGLLFFLLLFLVAFEFGSDRFIDFDFLNKKNIYPSLIITGFFLNLGLWIDKFLYWLHPDTGDNIISVLRASFFYDLPMFLAYMAMIPGMALFLLRLETDFAKKYDDYYTAVREGGTLTKIEEYREEMILTAKTSIMEVFKGQLIFTLIFIIFAEGIFRLLGIPIIYIPTFNIVVLGTWLLLFFLSILTILFYLDRRKEALIISVIFALSNGVFSYVTILLGFEYTGLGFLFSCLLSAILSLIILNKIFNRLTYETFMYQR
ncbi:MAG: hypothetical protein DSY53_02135 [Persephonella sp.]|nr:MAG: hypothetical protein DSY53_02135 [Persephonella sp.]